MARPRDARSVAALRWPLRLVLFCAACLGSTTALPSVPVASFSLADVAENRGDSVLELVAALEATGIIALRDVPAYVETRAAFLAIATACATTARVGVLVETLQDGTTVRGIRTKTQLHHPQLAQSTVARECPQYLPELRAFSELLNVVALRLARAIDGALKGSASAHLTRDKLEDVVATAHHLDHFHAYLAPRAHATPAAHGNDDDAVLSLDLHTDDGVMILMTAPEFYSLRDSTPVRVARAAIQSGLQASAGLVMKQPPHQHVVQPVIKDDELIVMIGEGYKAWLYAPRDFTPMRHGVQMPQFSPELGQVSRSWFGKMIRLPRTGR